MRDREIASREQLLAAYLRWAIVTAPLLALLGFASLRLAPSGTENRWYQILTKPSDIFVEWASPALWGLSYVLLGLALATVLNARRAKRRGIALFLFLLYLLCILAWPPLFFGRHLIPHALLTTGGGLVTGLLTLIFCARVRLWAGVLILPGLAWLAYAGFILYQLNQLNPYAATLVPSITTNRMPLNDRTGHAN